MGCCQGSDSIYYCQMASRKAALHSPHAEVLLQPARSARNGAKVGDAGGSSDLIRLLTLNVSGPSLIRASKIVDYLLRLSPDVIVLTETRGTPGTDYLLSGCRDAGYTVFAPRSLAWGERGVAIAHRLSAAPTPRIRTVDLAHRLLVTRLGSPVPITLVGAYVPSRDASPSKIARKRAFLSQMTCLVKRLPLRQAVILMGDFNVVERSHVPRYSSFRSWEYDSLAEIASCGLVDAFSELHPGVRAYSWYGRTGDGYRYDYGFVSHQLRDHLRACEYLDEPRDLAISDHAGLLLTLDSVASDCAPAAPPEASLAT